MKILELRFKNLNSLYGEWLIDFSDAEYTANGIFALIGPTGAGKSTVLDAICLALYGATPRLGKITQSTNEIMSRQTGECYAEVLFQTHDGQYRTHWQQRRARKQSDGALQAPVHEIVDNHTKKILESKKSLVAGVIEEKTGMDFDRFTRAILLAQGGFDTFLKADVEQKSTILEQITGTDIYSDISMKVFARQREEKQQLAILQAKAEGVELLSSEAEQEIRQQQTELAAQLSKLNTQSQTVNKALQWLHDIDKLEQSLAKLAQDKVALEEAQTAFAPSRTKLERGRQAASIEGAYIAYEQLRRQQEKDEAALRSYQAAVPELETALTAAQQSLEGNKTKLAAHKQALADKQTVLKTVRALDVSLSERRASVQQLEQDIGKETAAIDRHQAEVTALKQKKSAFADAMAEITQYEQEYAQDVNLLSEHGAVTALYEDWRARLAEMQTAQEVYKEKKQAFVQQQAQQISNDDLKEAQQALARVNEALNEKIAQRDALLDGQTLKAYREQMAQLQTQAQQMALVASLAEQRQALIDGEPCPLCGASEHPYAEHGNLSDDANCIQSRMQSLRSTIEQIEALGDEIAELQREQYAARAAYDKFVQQQQQQETHLKHLADNLRERQASLEEYEKRAQEREQALASKMAVYELGVSEKDRQKLAERLARWQHNATRKQQLVNDEQTVERQLQDMSMQINFQRETLAKYQQALAEQQAQYQTKKNERQALLGDDDPDAVEARLQQAVEQAQVEHDAQLERVQECQHALQQTHRQIQDKQQQINDNQPVMAAKQTAFTDKLEQKSFADEQAFLQARLPENELEALSEQAQALSDRQAALSAQQQDQHAQLSTLKAQALTNQPRADIEQQLTALTSQIEEAKAALHKHTFQLEANEKAKTELKSHYEAIEKQQQECKRWDELNALIGSSDGKKYRSFAQGLTFEVMVGHANQQLEKMTDRYRLMRDPHEALTLNVVDFYQASEVRSIKNLSGGESFIVSLALALGLSNMASQKVQIDSLFLDEGFGTLDEHALDTALNMLSELQQSGKLIGIISHVGALKERIATQINVSPVSNGKSQLQGPGCKRL